MSSKSKALLSVGARHLVKALQSRYPKLGPEEIETLGNEMLMRMSRSIAAGELPASVKRRRDGSLELRVWDIDKWGRR